MNLSYFTLRRLSLDIGHYEGGRVERAALAVPNALVLSLSREGNSNHLYLSASRSHGRVSLRPTCPDLSEDRPSWLTRYLEKSIVQSVELSPGDRILTLSLVRRDRLGDTFKSHIVAEMIGRNANVHVVDQGTGRIISPLRPVKGQGRRLIQGMTYEPPPAQNRKLPNALTHEDMVDALASNDDPVDALCTTVAGMDDLTAREIIHQAEGAEPAALLAGIQAYDQAPPFAPQAFLIDAGRGAKHVSPFYLTHIDETHLQACDDISAAIEAAVQDEQTLAASKGKTKELRRLLVRRGKSITDRCSKIELDIAAANGAEEVEREGNLILSQLNDIPEGSGSVPLRDLYAPGEPEITVELNPKLSPVENGNARIRRARKLTKSLPILERRLERSRREAEQFTSLVAKLDALTDEAEVEAFRERLVGDGLIRPQKQRPAGHKRAPGEIHPRRYLTSDGWEVWVGRTDAENDRITKAAARNDIWMHAQGCPGSHVVLRKKTPQAEPTPTALEEAAALAAYWSKARGSKTVPVNWTEARHVQKPRGAPPGLVTIRNEKTVFVQPHEIRRTDEVD